MPLDLNLINKNERNYWLYLQKYLDKGNFDLAEIYKAYTFAFEEYKFQTRRSGEPFISHPVWVAKIAAQLNLGQEALIVALLHHCFKNEPQFWQRLQMLFGPETVRLAKELNTVNSRTKGVKIYGKNWENLRKFVAASAKDIRGLIIRLIDKLHDSLTVAYLSPAQKINFARRALGLYAPLAGYIGLNHFQPILEDTAFKIMYPQEAQEWEKIVKKNYRKEARVLYEFKKDLTDLLAKNPPIGGGQYEVQARIKGLYASYLKTQHKGEIDLKDRIGFRVITQNITDCYRVLGVLHSNYPYVKEEFNDYISVPKDNGYQTIQTTLQWKHKLWVEVQIRTEEMHQLAEFGPASHTIYKIGDGRGLNPKYSWIRKLIQWQKNTDNVNSYQVNVLANFIYVFTPKGDIIELPAGATVKDFAYKIHTELGKKCKKGKVNGKIVDKYQVLKTGDKVEVI